MLIFERGYHKLYYFFANQIIRKKPVSLPDSLKTRVNLFLYFDYEREFGGHKTNICNDDIKGILDILDKYHFKTTWFTVGRIFEKYPESIQEITFRGHEIGSHTYAHISPIKAPADILNEDFRTFHEVSQPYAIIKGFHAPNGKWSLGSVRNLKRFGFHYDMDRRKNKDKRTGTFFLKLFNDTKLLRIYSVGDDWPLFKKGISKNAVFEYYAGLLKKISAGEIGGLGVHPWVLVSDRSIFEGYIMFLNYLTIQENVNVNTANFYTSEILIKDHLERGSKIT